MMIETRDGGHRTREIAERRRRQALDAVREHKRAARTKPYPVRGDDLRLYRRIEEILGEQI